MGTAFERGRILYRQARYGMAGDEFRKEIADNPQANGAMSMLALCLNQVGQNAQAVAMAQQAIAIAPNHAFAHYALASVMIGPPSRIPRAFSNLIWNARYRMFRYRHRVKKAMRPALEAVRLDPSDADYLLLVGAFEYDLRHYRRALEYLDRGLAEDPQHVRCANLRAKTLLKLGRIHDAKQTLKGAISVDPENPAVHATSGLAYMKTGDRDRAVEHLTEAVRLDPTNATNRAHLERALAKKALPWFAILYGFSMLLRSLGCDGSETEVVIGGLFLITLCYYAIRQHRSGRKL